MVAMLLLRLLLQLLLPLLRTYCAPRTLQALPRLSLLRKGILHLFCTFSSRLRCPTW